MKLPIKNNTNNNNSVLLAQLLEQKRREIAPDRSADNFFQLFASEQALKNHDLSYDEIEDGIVDGGGDGGIDGIYLFINGVLTHEKIDTSKIKSRAPMHLIFIQSKISSKFSEEPINKLISSTRDLLNLTIELDDLSSVYKEDLRNKISLFRENYLLLTSKFPQLSIYYYYASQGSHLHPNVSRKVEALEEIVRSFYTPVEFHFEFLGSSELLSLARQAPTSSHQLQMSENPITTGDQGYVCLVKLKDYFSFITENNGFLKERIFESNVRDYQGETEVNMAIRKSLSNRNLENFWWLNNGVSIVCTFASVSGKTLTIENPEVVNGLQTSREIYQRFQEGSELDERSVLVRVLVPQEPASRDRIIRATNSQTPIPTASLRATDKIHRDIEDYLEAKGWFYDRRKNFYKNLGKPVRNIVSISSMAQFVLACALRDPANARARPSSLLKRDEDYQRIFDEHYPIRIYLVCVELARKIDDILRSDNCSMERNHINNVRYYALMLLGLRLSGGALPTMIAISQIDFNNATEQLCLECINDSNATYIELGATDQIAKGTELSARLLEKHRSAIISAKQKSNFPGQTSTP